MKITSSIHNHCTHCDGKNTPREMVESAIRAGFTDFGFSSHSFIERKPSDWTMQDEESYKNEIFALKKEYEGKINLYCGIEVEYYSLPREKQGYDYMIDSVHELKVDDDYYSIDGSPSGFEKAIREGFGGDAYKLSKSYYDTVCSMIEDRKPKLVCHIDLVTKFNDKMRYFDEGDKRYQSPLYDALNYAIEREAVIELNYGAVARKHRTTPYPALYVFKYLREKGAKLLIGSDCHNRDYIDFGFKEGVELLLQNGFKTVTVYENGEWVEKPLL